jgi:hypothetical protein
MWAVMHQADSVRGASTTARVAPGTLMGAASRLLVVGSLLAALLATDARAALQRGGKPDTAPAAAAPAETPAPAPTPVATTAPALPPVAAGRKKTAKPVKARGVAKTAAARR